jgi:hypothetical protein
VRPEVPSILHMCLTDVPDVAARRYRDLRLVHLGSADTGFGRGAGTRLGNGTGVAAVGAPSVRNLPSGSAGATV